MWQNSLGVVSLGEYTPVSLNDLNTSFMFWLELIEDYNSGKITYTEAEFNACVKIYQSVNPNFNPDVEYIKDPIYRYIPSVDNSLFIIARKLILGL